MLAPVLARLDELPGVAASRAEASGRFFLLELHPGADPAEAARAVQAALGPGCRLLAPAEAAAQLEARGRGDPWLRAGELLTLSYVEGRILAVRLSLAAARAAALPVPSREALAEALRVELFRALERVHGEGGRASGGWIYGEWPALAAAALARSGLDGEERRRLAALLPGLLVPSGG